VLAVPTADDPLVVDDGGQLHENVTRGERQLALAQCRIILQRHHAAFDSGRDVFGVAAVLGGALEDGDVVFGRWRQIEALRHDRGGGGGGRRKRRRKRRADVGRGGRGKRRGLELVVVADVRLAAGNGWLTLAFRHLAGLISEVVSGPEFVDAESRSAEDLAGVAIGA